MTLLSLSNHLMHLCGIKILISFKNSYWPQIFEWQCIKTAKRASWIDKTVCFTRKIQCVNPARVFIAGRSKGLHDLKVIFWGIFPNWNLSPANPYRTNASCLEYRGLLESLVQCEYLIKGSCFSVTSGSRHTGTQTLIQRPPWAQRSRNIRFKSHSILIHFQCNTKLSQTQF